MTTPQRRTSERITPELIEQYRTWTPEAAAQVYDRRLRVIEEGYSLTFTEIGMIMLEAEARELWKYTDKTDGTKPSSLFDWVHDAMPVSHGTAFDAKKAAEVLKGIPVEERAQIPRGNLMTMVGLSTKVAESSEVRKAATRLKPKDFREMIERDYPEQHVEALKPMRFNPQRSARKVIDEALEMAMVLEETESRDEALEKICQRYVDDNTQEYRKALMDKRRERPTAIQ